MEVAEHASGGPGASGSPTVFNTVLESKRALELTRSFPRNVAKGSTLFRPEDPRQLYHVESGALCHYTRSAEGHYKVIEFVFAGDLIGLGCLAAHVSTARAMADTCVTAIAEADLESFLATDVRLHFRVAEATEREFDYQRKKYRSASLRPPVQRLANFILAAVGIHAAEGCEPLTLKDDISSSFGDRLQMSGETLAEALLSLRRSGLVDESENGLRVLNISALETLAK